MEVRRSWEEEEEIFQSALNTVEDKTGFWCSEEVIALVLNENGFNEA